jgi:hypothetical protein
MSTGFVNATWIWLLFSSAAMIDVRPAAAQSEESTFIGTVSSSTRNTLVVRSTEGQYRLFVFEPGAKRPATLTAGMRVRVISTPSDDPGARLATEVTVIQGPPSTAAGSAGGDIVPPEVRRTERAIEREARRLQVGVRAGVALNPELIMIGVHAQVGPFFNRNIFFRPNVEFAYGEVTALFGLNPEVIYRLPLTSRAGRWSAYVGGGPGFNFTHQSFQHTTNSGSRIDFGDFSSDTGLNILGGLRFRSGVFTELKTSLYTDPAPRLRLIVGYNF